MTAFIGILDKDFVIQGTDTLATYPKQDKDKCLQPRSYTNKTFILPQFKSTFSVTGTLQLGLCFYNLIVESAIGIDIDSLIKFDLNFFKQKLKKDYNQILLGTIFLFGYSNQQKCFKGFKLIADNSENFKWNKYVSDVVLLKPNVENWEEKHKQSGKVLNYSDFIINLMKIQKQEDEELDFKQQVGIGGEIIFTQFGFDDKTENLTINTQIIHQFEDYISLGNKMILK